MVGRPRIPIRRLSDPCCPLRLLLGPKPLSTAAPDNPHKAVAAASSAAPSEATTRDEAYRQLQNLDFMTAAKILFTTPPKRKKFGLDFHLVQLFFVCMPSLAVYLVAQYARYEIRRMEAEAELKKKQAEEEEKAKAAELGSIEEGSDPQLSKVIVRLDALEEAVKEIVHERKKDSPSHTPEGQEVGKKEQVAPADKSSDPQTKSKGGELTSDGSSKMVSGSSPTVVSAEGCTKQIEKLTTESRHLEK